MPDQAAALTGGEGANGPRSSATRLDDHAVDGGQLVAGGITKRYGKGADSDPTGAVAHSLTSEGFDASEDGTGRGTPLTTFAVEPESGQGADLRAREVDVASGIDSHNKQAHDRGVRVVAAPLTAGKGAGEGVSAAGRRQEDDVNLTTFAKRHNAEDPESAETWDASDYARTLADRGTPTELAASGEEVGGQARAMVRRLTPT